MKLTLNVNDSVRVVLTQAGADQINKFWREVGIPDSQRTAAKPGPLDTQLWVLMMELGPGVHHGMPKPFIERNEIELKL
jgi:hypothetical protein